MAATCISIGHCDEDRMNDSLPYQVNTTHRYLPAVLNTSLFFLCGVSYGFLDLLNRHFQETLDRTRPRSALLQASYFGPYFRPATLAAAVIGRRAYKFAILCGLGLSAFGALLVIPSTLAPSFPFFL